MPLSPRLERIATQARAYPDLALTTLAHHLDGAMLAHALRSLNPQRAPGGDRVTWRTDTNHLETHLETWDEQRGNGTSCPHAVVRRLIPTGGGKLRPWGLPALEDTMVAQAVALLMEASYEQDVCDFSDGVRRGRRPHQAWQAVRQGLLGSRRGSVIDGGIRAFVDHVPHDTRWAILRTRIKDGRGLECIERWLHAGILDGKEMVFPEKGSPQGSVRSPRWAHVDVHEGLDTWCETVVQAHGRGTGVLDRSADDWVMGCEWEEDARRITEVLPKRCATYGRESNTAKTKWVDCGRPQRPSSGHTAGTCSFLGVVHDWGKTWRGSDPSKRKTEGQRLRRTLGECWRGCRDHRHRPLQAQSASLGAKLRGYDQ